MFYTCKVLPAITGLILPDNSFNIYSHTLNIVHFFPKMSHTYPILINFSCSSVRSSSERTTIISSYLVRWSTWFQKKKYDRSTNRSWKTWCYVSCVQYNLYDVSYFTNGFVHEETICQVYLSFFVLRFFSQ